MFTMTVLLGLLIVFVLIKCFICELYVL